MLQALLQTIQSHDGAVKSVLEKGEALLASVHFPSIRDNTNRLHNDYTTLYTITAVRSLDGVLCIKGLVLRHRKRRQKVCLFLWFNDITSGGYAGWISPPAYPAD